ncbi:MAG: bifunctional oligoribonuclease/PAP phosphatase NrnA, partial [Firmicutes bacterium]|nr:bifunctional oligoribonuclease/PAP phosphatase NrnA [Bacillota bacterium]
ILIEDKIADNLSFLDDNFTTFDAGIFGAAPDVCVAVDNGEPDRFPKRKEAFYAGKTIVCIDHHPTSKPFANYNYIDPAAAATGEIIFDLIAAMGAKVDKKIAEALFAAITTDCGNFQYSNTTRRTFEIACELMDTGFNLVEVSNAIYQNNPPQKIRLEAEIMGTLELCGDGKVAIAYVTQKMLSDCEARLEDTEGCINVLRGIAGVEVAALFKENDERKIKLSMRAKSYANVAEVAQKFGGGGHVRAAGCTLEMPMKEAIETMKPLMVEAV